MLSRIGSPVTTQSDSLIRSDRDSGLEDNIDWLHRQASELAVEASNSSLDESTYVLLFGGVDRTAFRLRLAQAHLRNDLWPSHWSHVALLAPSDDAGINVNTQLYEASLQPEGGFQTTVTTNGMELVEPVRAADDVHLPELVTVSRLDRYRDPLAYPNIALLRINVPAATWASRSPARILPDPSGSSPAEVTAASTKPDEMLFSVIESFARQRGMIDLPELILVWLSFLWGVGHTPNPLFEGRGIPSAVMVDSVLGAVGYDVSPGSDSRLTCPETIWQTAKWWQLYYRDDPVMTAIAGRYDVASKINEHLLASPQVERSRG